MTELLLTKISANDLMYLSDTSSSLVTERTQKREHADSTSYQSSGNIVINLQTGVDYIDFTKSMLHLKIEAIGNTLKFRQYGTILDIIDRVKLSSRSGTVISTIDNVNVLNNLRLGYMATSNWKNQQGASLLGLNTVAPLTVAVGATSEFNIPMGWLSGLFRKEQLCPAQLASGMRIEITLASVGNVHVVGAVPTNYTVSDVYCELDSYRLTDPALNILNTMSSSKDGLVFEFREYSSTTNNKSANVANFSFQSRKTAAIANSVMCVRRKTANIGEPTVDSLMSVVYAPADEYQFKVGNLYLPQQKVVGLENAYAEAAYCLDRLRPREELGIDKSEFAGDASAGIVGFGFGMMCANLERYYLNLSGLALNNSNSLNFNGKVQNAGDEETFNIFINYTARAQIFNENVVMSS